MPVESAMIVISRKPQPPMGVIIRSDEADFVRVAQSPQGQGEDGGEHDGLKDIVSHQGNHRHHTPVAEHKANTDQTTRGTGHKHVLWLHSA